MNPNLHNFFGQFPHSFKVAAASENKWAAKVYPFNQFSTAAEAAHKNDYIDRSGTRTKQLLLLETGAGKGAEMGMRMGRVVGTGIKPVQCPVTARHSSSSSSRSAAGQVKTHQTIFSINNNDNKKGCLPDWQPFC